MRGFHQNRITTDLSVISTPHLWRVDKINKLSSNTTTTTLTTRLDVQKLGAQLLAQILYLKNHQHRLSSTSSASGNNGGRSRSVLDLVTATSFKVQRPLKSRLGGSGLLALRSSPPQGRSPASAAVTEAQILLNSLISSRNSAVATGSVGIATSAAAPTVLSAAAVTNNCVLGRPKADKRRVPMPPDMPGTVTWVSSYSFPCLFVVPPLPVFREGVDGSPLHRLSILKRKSRRLLVQWSCCREEEDLRQ